METEDKLVIEDLTMGMAAFIRTLAVLRDPGNKQAIDAEWEGVKVSFGRIFTKWHDPDDGAAA